MVERLNEFEDVVDTKWIAKDLVTVYELQILILKVNFS